VRMALYYTTFEMRPYRRSPLSTEERNFVSGVYCAFTVFALLLSEFSLAQNSLAMEHTLTTGAYSPVAVGDLTATTDILDRDRIEVLNKRTVAQLLKTVPGVLVEELGGPGGLTAVSIRGGESNFTLVLLDGVAVNDPTNTRGGGFDFSRLNPASVERIEIVRGSQSAIYGSDALAGVINIITRRGVAGHRQQVAAGGPDFAATRRTISPIKLQSILECTTMPAR
jgi:vitamin B12 transporter